ncbi:MAG: UDP-N-acetylmuramate--L-alanine ligase [Clostridia bacterium]|nr:UDP-N-acetylmuramate--L-alanine ligase [Clostridia bacterium]
MDITNHKNIFFIGIGGISMSSLAEILVSKGYNVSGSNNVDNEMTDKLKEKNIKVFIGHNKDNITSDIDLVVYTAAISKDNEELLKANELGIETIRREILLSCIMDLHKNKIAISGTHGKTTTSSMISEVFMKANTNPTISIGGVLKSLDSNTFAGGDEYFIAEACEYKDSFLALNPSCGVILNIDADHLDYFKDLNDIRKSFKQFIKNLNDGLLVINNNVTAIDELTNEFNGKVVTYGNQSANCKADNITYQTNGLPSFDIVYNGEKIINVSLKVPGYHNVSNALAAFSVCYEYGIDTKFIKEGLENFIGTERRMELKGEYDGIKVFDDYAHHPTEIKASISAFKSMPKNNLYTVFQSHTYTRTKALLNEFATSLSDSDYVIITDIYAARETNDVNVYPEDLVELIKEINPNVCYISKYEDIVKHLKKECQKGDIIVAMGAGDANKICDMLLK